MVAVLLMVVWGVSFAATILIIIRNEWVFCQRRKLIDRIFADSRAWFRAGCPTVDDLYLTYNQMVFRFWIWDVEKLRKDAA